MTHSERGLVQVKYIHEVIGSLQEIESITVPHTQLVVISEDEEEPEGMPPDPTESQSRTHAVDPKHSHRPRELELRYRWPTTEVRAIDVLRGASLQPAAAAASHRPRRPPPTRSCSAIFLPHCSSLCRLRCRARSFNRSSTSRVTCTKRCRGSALTGMA